MPLPTRRSPADADALLAAWAEGTAMTLNQAIAVGRELLAP